MCVMAANRELQKEPKDNCNVKANLRRKKATATNT